MTTGTQRCVSCGAVDSITPTTPSRTITYRSVPLTLPPLNLPECGSCHDMQLDAAQSDIYSAAIDAAYAAAQQQQQQFRGLGALRRERLTEARAAKIASDVQRELSWLSWLSVLSPSSQALFFTEVAEAEARGESLLVLIQQWRNTATAVAAGIDLVTPLDPDALEDG